jgi:hypothetical protein
MNYKEKIDYSSLSTYMDCQRKFLFQYIFHFRSPNPSIDLIFGSCWHYGLESTYKELMKNPASLSVIQATEISINAFNDLWKIEGAKHFPNEDLIFPKSPGRASDMYYKYWERYLLSEDSMKKIIGVEAPFLISLSTIHPGLPNYIGRQDLLFELPDGSLEIVDHKTAKALWKTTLNQFEMSYQTDGYLTAGEMYYNKIPKITYSLAFFQKSKMAFQRFTIMKNKACLDQFLHSLIFYCKDLIKQIDLFEQELETKTVRNDIINSFPRSPGYACTLYMRACPYMDLCKIRNNPLLWYNNPPQGYTINEWDPDKQEKELKNKLKQGE